MIIGIEAERANHPNPTGVEHYAKQMILNLAKIDTRNSYILYLRTKPQEWLTKLPSNFSYKVMPFPIFWTQLRISWEMIWNRPDALFIMASALPLIHPKNSIITIHDLAWEFYPETFGRFMLRYLQFSTWHSCTFSKSVIAVSEQTRKDILKKYKLNPDKVKTIHHGFDIATEISYQNQESLKLPEKFILYLGTLQPRKNIIGLIDAFIAIKDQIPHKLVLVGGKGWLYDQIMTKIQNHPEVIYLGYVQNRFDVLKKADLLVQPAFYEGFGMQILDAFYSKVPVACSNISSLPEVAGDAAVYFDPNNSKEIQSAILEILKDQSKKESLVAKGSERLKEFSWDKAARETLEVLKG
jgi:glycosyltransferase involved in cell wall biosynthesis